jgi:hypothetical protein
VRERNCYDVLGTIKHVLFSIVADAIQESPFVLKPKGKKELDLEFKSWFKNTDARNKSRTSRGR